MKYHLRRTDRQIEDPATLEDLLRHGRYATLALCRGGEPYLVTLSYGYSPTERALYFHCAPEGLKTDFVWENPSACATIIRDNGYVQGQCAHRYASVVIRGRVEILTEPDAKRRALDVLVQHLEEQPETMQEKLKLPERQRRMEAMHIWKLPIESLSGKAGS